LLFLAASIHENHLQLIHCHPKSEIFWENYLARYRPHLLHHFPYTPFELPFYEWINLLQAFAWSFSDVLVILMAIGITTRFNQFYNRFQSILKSKELMTHEDIWTDLRLHYFKLIELVQFVDSQISMLLLVSMSHNMFVMLLKIFNALKPDRLNVLGDIYFWVYLVYLLTRSFGALFFIAGMNEAAKKPLQCIRSVPSEYWNINVSILCKL